MTELDLLIYGSLWRNAAHFEAGLELIRCLGSADERARTFAHELLVDAGPRSITLLQAAVASGEVEGKDAAKCFAALLIDGAGNEAEVRDLLAYKRSDC